MTEEPKKKKKRTAPFRRHDLYTDKSLIELNLFYFKHIMEHLRKKSESLLEKAVENNELQKEVNHKFWIAYGMRVAMEEVHQYLLNEKWFYTKDLGVKKK
jgi:hypothetical protein